MSSFDESDEEFAEEEEPRDEKVDDAGNVAVETPGFPPEVSSLDGTEVHFKNKYGDVLQNRQRFVDARCYKKAGHPTGAARLSSGSGPTATR